VELIGEALAMDPDVPIAVAILSTIHVAKQEFVQAVEAAERAATLDPNNYLNQGILSYNLVVVGRSDEAIYRAKQAQRLSPIHADWIENVLGLAYILSGDYARALATFHVILDQKPAPGREAVALPRLALVYSAMGREEDARNAIARTIVLDPRMSIAQQLGRLPIQDAIKRASIIATWRRLGLPEE
jgi:tetratricopeptide (TPR) repeat protein